MANTTIDQLASLTGTSVASNDLFLVYDASTNIEKSITSAEMKNMIGNGSFTFTIAGTSDALIVTSTDAGAAAAPDIVFYRNSASPAASDAIGNIVFRGKSSTGVNRDYAGIFTNIVSPTNTAETGQMTFNTMNAGTLAERMRITSAGNVGIGTASPSVRLDVRNLIPVVSTSAADSIAYFGNEDTTATATTRIALRSHQGDSFRERTYLETGLEGVSGGYFSIWTRPTGTSITEKVRITGAGNVGIGTNAPTAKLQVSGQIAGGYTAHTAGTVAMALATNSVVKVTPNATATFTTTVAPAGSRAAVIVVTSGTTSYTITFGTGFLTTGTLATGTTTAKTFVIEFVSDGTTMIETGRTTAM